MKRKRTHPACRFLSLVLAMVFVLSALPVQAASYSTVVSLKDGKNGLVDYGSMRADYIVPADSLKLVEHGTSMPRPQVATVTFQKQTSAGVWVTDDDPPFHMDQLTSTYDEFLYVDAEDLTDTVRVYADRRVEILFPGGALGSDGSRHDFIMMLSDFHFRNLSGQAISRLTFMYQSFADGGLRMAATGGAYGVKEGLNASYDIHISIPDAKPSETVFLSFFDLDQPAVNNQYEGSFAEDSGVESIKIQSGIFPGTAPHVPGNHLLRIVDGSQPEYYAIQRTDNDEVWQSAMSYLACATGTTYRWMGTSCGTGFGLFSTDLPSLTVKTRVCMEQSDGKSYGSWRELDSKWFLRLMRPTYSYTYTKDQLAADEAPGADCSWIYDFDSCTVGESNITTDKVFDITINRNRYTYSFKANPPSGKTVSDVNHMPADQTVVAALEDSGRSRALVESPMLSGYVFKGWNTKTDGSGSAYPGAETMKSDKVFYAQWEPATYLVHFDANGSLNPDHETGEFTQNTTTGTMADQVMQFDVQNRLNINQFDRNGYTFAGWNTKADGSGTSYSDQQSVKNLIGYDKSEITLYAQWVKKLGTETITVVSEETGNPVEHVGMKLQKKVDDKWIDVMTGRTDEKGQITIDSLHWFDYRWMMEEAPAGYVRSADTAFHINWDSLQAKNQVILYLKHVQIVIDSQVSDVITEEQPPAFLYHIKGTDAAGVDHEYHLLVQTDAASKFGTNRVPDLFAGRYSITQTPVSRYQAETAVNISNSTADGISASVDVLNHDMAEVKFPYTIREYGWLYGVNSRVNHLSK